MNPIIWISKGLFVARPVLEWRSMKEQSQLKVLWALDPCDDLAVVYEKCAQFLKRLSRGGGVEVDPVSVLSPALLGISAEMGSQWAENYTPQLGLAVEQRVKGVDGVLLSRPKIIHDLGTSLRSAVDALAKHALTGGYELIVVGSHGRSGLTRLMVGSFAEELLLRSRVPVVVVGDHSKVWEDHLAQEPIHILLPNDLVDPEHPAFDEIFGLASRLRAKVTLLSVVPRPLDPVVQAGVFLLSGGWVSTPVYLDQECERRREIGKNVVYRAKHQYGVECDLVVEFGVTSVVEAILSQSESTRSHLVAMVGESGPLSSALLGSVTRQVVRSARTPVLVVRKQKTKES